tara:strand:- start:1181 stop:2632 length:1452 start_codon:yes stop_codon:yes gene_type:complete
MSEIKSNKISPRKGTTQTIGDSGDSVTISSGTTTTNAGTISTAGITGGTINNTTGTITGLQQAINWQTGSIKTTAFTASANEGYFCNTTSAAFTVTLPASPTAGDVVAVKDYADTFDTNNLTLNPNGNKIQGSTNNFKITVEGTAAILLYVDSTKGWLLVDQSKASDIIEDIKFVTATGGTITTCGDFKIHTFTGPGTFTVSCAGNSAGSNSVDYLVIAGGGSGGVGSSDLGGSGGGAGGYRESHSTPVSGSYTASPLATPTALTVTATAFPITVGAGGTSSSGNSYPGVNSGSNSVFSSITSAGGGHGSNFYMDQPPGRITGAAGGSGGGGGYGGSAGAGNTPPVSPPQGNNGGSWQYLAKVGGGGGAGAVGGNGSPGCAGGSSGSGGAGVATSITGSPVTRAGGGGGAGGGYPYYNVSAGSGGSGGGGAGGSGGSNAGTAGTANTGGGGGGRGSTASYSNPANLSGATGGSGIVIIRYKFQ